VRASSRPFCAQVWWHAECRRPAGTGHESAVEAVYLCNTLAGWRSTPGLRTPVCDAAHSCGSGARPAQLIGKQDYSQRGGPIGVSRAPPAPNTEAARGRAGAGTARSLGPAATGARGVGGFHEDWGAPSYAASGPTVPCDAGWARFNRPRSCCGMVWHGLHGLHGLQRCGVLRENRCAGTPCAVGERLTLLPPGPPTAAPLGPGVRLRRSRASTSHACNPPQESYFRQPYRCAAHWRGTCPAVTPPGCATACGLAHSRSSGRDGGGLRPPCATAAVVSGDARCGNSTKLGATPSRSSNPMPAVAAGPGVALVQRQVCQRRRPTTRHSLPRSRWELAASGCVLTAPGMLHAADPPATTTNSRASARSPAVSPMAAQAEMLPPPSCVRGPPLSTAWRLGGRTTPPDRRWPGMCCILLLQRRRLPCAARVMPAASAARGGRIADWPSCREDRPCARPETSQGRPTAVAAHLILPYRVRRHTISG
jgi:hypothetical protein